jgi:hypothetical protein
MSHFIAFACPIMMTMSKLLYTLVVFLKREKSLICKNKIKIKIKIMFDHITISSLQL